MRLALDTQFEVVKHRCARPRETGTAVGRRADTSEPAALEAGSFLHGRSACRVMRKGQQRQRASITRPLAIEQVPGRLAVGGIAEEHAAELIATRLHIEAVTTALTVVVQARGRRTRRGSTRGDRAEDQGGEQRTHDDSRAGIESPMRCGRRG